MGTWLRVVAFGLLATGMALFVGFVSTPRAAAVDVSPMAWASAADSEVASFVTSPFAPRAWGGDGGSIDSLGNLVADGYNAAKVDGLIGSLEDVAVGVGVTIDPWVLVGTIAVSALGAYVTYEETSSYKTWEAPWGNNAASGYTFYHFSFVSAGTRLVVGDDIESNYVYWTAPSDGWLLYATNGGGCYGTYPLVTSATTGRAADGDCRMSGVTAAKVDADMSGSATSATPWVRALGGQGTVFFNAGAYHSTPSGFNLAKVGTSAPPQEPTNLLCGGTGYNGYGCTGGAFKVGSSTDATIAQALRQKLTAPGDTCGGIPCPWGDNGGDPDASTTNDNSNTISCVIAGDCSATPLVPSFTMPDCYGLTASTCLADMQTLGFTGTLDEDVSATVDDSQPAGAVLSTSPSAGAAVSKLRDSTVDAKENPPECGSVQTDNPHWSADTGSMLAYVDIQCNFTGDASYSASMYQCSDNPGLDGVNLGAAGCVEVAACARTWGVTADTVVTVYCPYVTQGDPAVPYADGYWIATSVTTTPGAINGPATWSQEDWEPSPP